MLVDLGWRIDAGKILTRRELALVLDDLARTACKALGLERLRMLTIHRGRHTFISHALAGGRSLAEVRDAAGHCDVSITSCYLHIVVVEDDRVGEFVLLCRTSRHDRSGGTR